MTLTFEELFPSMPNCSFSVSEITTHKGKHKFIADDCVQNHCVDKIRLTEILDRILWGVEGSATESFRREIKKELGLKEE